MEYTLVVLAFFLLGIWLWIQVLCGLYAALAVPKHEVHLIPKYDEWYLKLVYLTPILVKKFRQRNISY